MPARETQPSRPIDSRAPRSGLLLMLIIVLAFAAVAIFANYEKAHLRDIEQVTVAPMATPGASVAGTPLPNEQ